MNIGVPKEREFENRVGLTPAGAGILVGEGHRVYVESKAGASSGFSDDEYLHAGAKIVYSPEEAWGRADLVTKVRAPVAREFAFLRDEQMLMGFLHLSVGPRSLTEALMHKCVTALAYETIQEADGSLPVVTPISEIAGRMAPLIAGELLTNSRGGKGILLGGLPGIPSADVAIIGGGVVGYNAAKAFLGVGAHVTILDNSPNRLRDLDDRLHGAATTMLATRANIQKVCSFADVLVGCILIPGARAPHIVTREMVRTMKSRSVILDISIDQGGCVETSRPTTIENPTYVEEGVIHYCVPNMSACVARTASHALTNAALPYISLVAREGLARSVALRPALAKGIMISCGHVVNPLLATAFGLEAWSLNSLLRANRT